MQYPESSQERLVTSAGLNSVFRYKKGRKIAAFCLLASY